MAPSALLTSWLTWAPWERAVVRSVYFQQHSIAETARHNSVDVVDVVAAIRRVHRSVAAVVADDQDRDATPSSADTVTRALRELTALPVGTWRWDTAGEAMTWSGALYELYGYPPDAVVATIGRHQSHKDLDDRLCAEALIMAGATEDGAVVFPQRIHRTDGTSCRAVMRVVREPGSREVLTGRVVVEISG